MKNMFKRITLSLTAALSLNAFALDVPNQTVTRTYINSSGRILFKVADMSASSSMCSVNRWYEISNESDWVNEMMYKQVITAKVTGVPMTIRVGSCGSEGPIVSFLDMKS